MYDWIVALLLICIWVLLRRGSHVYTEADLPEATHIQSLSQVENTLPVAVLPLEKERSQPRHQS